LPGGPSVPCCFAELKLLTLLYSRTQNQLKQAIKELKESVKLSWSPKTAVLASRSHLCVNPRLERLKGEDQVTEWYILYLLHLLLLGINVGSFEIYCNYLSETICAELTGCSFKSQVSGLTREIRDNPTEILDVEVSLLFLLTAQNET
jgi:hypothetical protein